MRSTGTGLFSLWLGFASSSRGVEAHPYGRNIQRQMSREVKICSRNNLIVSEPHEKGWKAQVLEVIEDDGTQTMDIETTGETRSVADDRAVGQLQHRLRDQSF